MGAYLPLLKKLRKVIILLTITKQALCSIAGITYMDPLINRHHQTKRAGDDPCNPLYWYPRTIPDNCHQPSTMKPVLHPVQPIPVPMPVPLPPPIPNIPVPMPVPVPPMPIPLPAPRPTMGFPMPAPGLPMGYPMPAPSPPMALPMPALMPALPQSMPFPQMPIPYPAMPQSYPMAPSPALPFGIPLHPTHPMVPVAGMPYAPPYQPRPPGPWAGMVPGIPGLVTRDGGINILPFSDAYSDMLEKHKNKMIRRKLAKIIRDYNRRY